MRRVVSTSAPVAVRTRCLCLGSNQCKQDAGEVLLEVMFTLIGDVEPWLVLRVVTVEKKAGLMGGAEQRLGDDRTAESVDDGAHLQRSTADL